MCGDSAVAPKGTAGAPEKEIEVTPDVIDAAAGLIEKILCADSLLPWSLIRRASEAVLRTQESENRARKC
jgi:hypothetical protein